MRIMAWYITGILCAYEVTQVFSSKDDIANLVLEPETFLAGAFLLLVSFIILSLTIRTGLINIIKTKRHKDAYIPEMIFSVILIIAGWGYLFYCSIWITLVLLILVLIYISLSYDKIQQEIS